MSSFSDKIRTPGKAIDTKAKIINTLLIFFSGVLLGIFSKWLDNLSINDGILWQRIIGILDLRNVFSMFGIWIFIATSISVKSNSPVRVGLNVFLFFVGMTVSYHSYTIYFSGFNPVMYIFIWYAITLISPILAFICWFANGDSKISIALSGMIISVMFVLSFNIGKTIPDLFIFLGTVYILHTKPKTTILSLFTALILVLIFDALIFF